MPPWALSSAKRDWSTRSVAAASAGSSAGRKPMRTVVASTQIKGEIAEADKACAEGDNLRALGLLRGIKARHGYAGS